MSDFSLYQEPLVFTWIVQIFSVLTYLSVCICAGYLLRLCLYAKKEILLKHTTIWLISIILTALAYFKIYQINILSIIIIFVTLSILSYRWIAAKSFKWINLSMALFILVIIATYNLFNTKIHEITYPYFSANDILEYKFTYKPYFEPYRPQENNLLGQVEFVVDGEKQVIKNDPIEFRIYSFYYVLNVIAIWFWLLIYFDILKKHNLKLGKVRKQSQKMLLYYRTPKNVVIHLSSK